MSVRFDTVNGVGSSINQQREAERGGDQVQQEQQEQQKENNLRSLWEDLLEYESAGHLMCLSTTGEDYWEKEERELLRASRARVRGDLVPGHAYAILNVHQTTSDSGGGGGHRLIQLRNPWSVLKWEGGWCRSSMRWTPKLRQEMRRYTPNVHEEEEPADGGGVAIGDTFWLSLEEAFHFFESLTVCRVGAATAATTDKKKKSSMVLSMLDGESSSTMERDTSSGGYVEGEMIWSECRVRGAFSTSEVDNIVKTNMYLLDIPSDTDHVILQLHQRDCTIYGERKYVDIGLTLLSLTEGGETYRMVPGGSTGCQLNREVTLELDVLPAGRYVIVPISSGCKYRHEVDEEEKKKKKKKKNQGDQEEEEEDVSSASTTTTTTTRVLRLTTRRQDTTTTTTTMNDTKSDDDNNGTTAARSSNHPLGKYQSPHLLTPECEKAFTEIFDRLDEDMDGILNKMELDGFMMMSEGTLMHDDVHAWVMKTFHVSTSDGRRMMKGGANSQRGGGGGELGLTREGFIQLYLYMFDENGASDEDVLWRDLKFMGYDKNLKLTRSTT